MPESFVPLTEAARRLKFSYQKTWRLCVCGQLDAARQGRNWLVSVAAIEQHIAERAKRRAGPAR